MVYQIDQGKCKQIFPENWIKLFTFALSNTNLLYETKSNYPAYQSVIRLYRSPDNSLQCFSHNDYERPRPLFDAFSFQFNCVEADLWLIDGELYVSHDSVAPNPDITFEKLYLLPLVERIKRTGAKYIRTATARFT